MGDDGGGGGGCDGSSVKVAVRIRPQLAKEIIDACKICITKTPGEPQTWLGSNKAFTFDYVYDTESGQQDVYQDTVHDLIEGCFEGYNATVLAYGQTGSGKTYTMGTGFELSSCTNGSGDKPTYAESTGIIPRAVRQLFAGIAERQSKAKDEGTTPPEFKVSAQFLELYNEEIVDLFADFSGKSNNAMTSSVVGGIGKRSTSASTQSGIRIHEDAGGNIYTVGATSRTVHSDEETISCLKSGAFNRTTASTKMNDQSSRSHAIFTLYIQQQRPSKPETNPFHLEPDPDDPESPVQAPVKPADPGDFETLTAKFHFVDLAGSERLKRTGATGDRAKEGISINCGLLALGNVISALGDVSKKASHVPYRDSKLTRMLQDSLGGNSRTQMIACVSPSDRDFMETLNTLKYANRARNIKNKVTANQDKTSRTIALLRTEIQNLQLELMEYRQGKRVVGADGEETTNDMYHENTMLNKENSHLRTRIKALQETVDVLTAKNSQLLADKEVGNWIRENGSIGSSEISSSTGGESGSGGSNNDITAMVQKYITEVEELRARLLESEQVCEQLRKETARVKRISQQFHPSVVAGGTPIKNAFASPATSGFLDLSTETDADSGLSVQELIDMAKKELEKKKAAVVRKKSAANAPGGKENKDAGKGGGSNVIQCDTNKLADEDKDANSADDEDDGSDDVLEDGFEDDDEDVDDDDESDEDEDDENSDTEESDNNKASQQVFNEELVELTSEISLKQKLIEELEMSQKRLHTMKQQYETKLIALQERIQATQVERDKVLKNLKDPSKGLGGGSGGVETEKITKIKHDYQDKLDRLQCEVKKLQSAKKEHAKLLRNQSQYERQVEKLKSEVGEMKRSKVKLVQKMKEESNRHREQENRRNREMSQMKKQTRVNESKIKSLEAEKRLKENVLRRKTEEVTALRRANQRKMSLNQNNSRGGQMAGGGGGKPLSGPPSSSYAANAIYSRTPQLAKKKTFGGGAGVTGQYFNSRAAKTKWSHVEKSITKVALNRQAVAQMENDMDRWLREREKLSHKLEKMTIKRRRLISEKGDSRLVEDLDDQIENLKTNVAYLHDNIVECQQNIVQMEQSGNGPDEDEEASIAKQLNIQDMRIDEAKYLLEKLLTMTISQTCLATQKEGSIREMENRMTQAMKQNTLHQQLLQHMIEQQDLEIYDLMLANEQGDDDSDSDSEDVSLASALGANPSGNPNSVSSTSGNPTVSVTLPLPLSSGSMTSSMTSQHPPSNHHAAIEAVLSEAEAVGSDSSFGRREKARRKMTTKEDMMFNDTDFEPYSLPSPSSNPMTSLPPSNTNNIQKQSGQRIPFQRSLSFTKDPNSGPDGQAPGGWTRQRSFVRSNIANVRSSLRRYPGQRATGGVSANPAGNNMVGGGNNDIMTQSVDQSIISRLAPVYQPSPLMNRRLNASRSSLRKYNSAAKLNSQSERGGGMEGHDSPPGSPTTIRSSRPGSARAGGGGVMGSSTGDLDSPTSGAGKNVFHRLVAGTTIGESSRLPDKGRINPFQGRIAPKSPLICTHVAEGHTKAVLSVFATDELLLSASKDRTVKVWDLCRQEEVQSLGGHPNNVVVVKYSEPTRLAFTVSSAFIKVWDLRMSAVNCIKTLSSSGLTTNGPVQLPANRTLAMPPGEAAINDIALTSSGYGLFSAAGDKVRIWDLRKFHSIGKLSGGHQAAVMCLTTGQLNPGGFGSGGFSAGSCGESGGSGGEFSVDSDPHNYVITGSKDHYIKVFNVGEGKGGVIAPSTNLDPPHYDGIECLALSGDTLFSASRDFCIKKWNLRTGELVRSINNAHKDWICGLAHLPGGQVLVSGCRAGIIKLWSTETCCPVGEMKAHNSTINTIATNSSTVFTGSNDGSIGMWRIRNTSYDKSPDTSESS